MLRCENVSLGYPGKPLCRNLNLCIEPGQCWAVLGGNGSGKTTLLHALGGLSPTLEGGILLDGVAISTYPRRVLARLLGVLLQSEENSFWGSVKEYALLGRYPHAPFGPRPEDHAAAHAAVERLELVAQAAQSYATLSGGERQRTRIAALVAQAPRIFLLDEPLQHLDLRHQIAALSLFRELARREGGAVIMVLHDLLWAARYCDHALLLFDDGTNAAGPVAELLRAAPLERLYRCRLAAVAPGLFIPVEGV